VSAPVSRSLLACDEPSVSLEPRATRKGEVEKLDVKGRRLRELKVMF